MHVERANYNPFIINHQRMQFLGELGEIRDTIQASGMNDAMTRAISDWQERFMNALRAGGHEEDVINEYTRLLQELLCDPVSMAPLDSFALLGSDGRTYSQMTLRIFELSVPEEYRNRCPMDPESLEPFVVTPHLVVRHMIGWLERHGRLLYSEEVERQYLELLPHDDRAELDERIQRLIERQEARERFEMDQMRMDAQNWDQGFEERLLTWFQEMRARLPAQQERVRVEEDEEFLRLQAQLDAQEHVLERVGAQLEEVRAQGQAENVRLEERIRREVAHGMEHIERRIDDFARRALGDIQQAGNRDQEMVRQLEERIRVLHDQTQHMTEENEQLRESQQRLSGELDQTRQSIQVLRGEIRKTEIAIQDMKENSLMRLLSTVAVVAVACFATWGVQSVLSETSLIRRISFRPMLRGAGAKFSIFAF